MFFGLPTGIISDEEEENPNKVKEEVDDSVGFF